MWEIQKEPFAGDVVNSYNDGPPAPGAKPLGPFYELETSSPAAALAPGESLTHVHRTFHFQGEERDLDALARRLLGTGLERVRTALPSGRGRIPAMRPPLEGRGHLLRVLRGGISTFPYLEYYEALARVRGRCRRQAVRGRPRGGPVREEARSRHVP